jgi:hypothetical protein
MRVSCLGYSSVLKKEATRSPEKSVDFQQTTRHNILEVRTLHNRWLGQDSNQIHPEYKCRVLLLHQSDQTSWSNGCHTSSAIRMALDSHASPKTCYPDSGFHGFRQSFQAGASVVPHVRARPLSPRSSRLYTNSIMLSLYSLNDWKHRWESHK